VVVTILLTMKRLTIGVLLLGAMLSFLAISSNALPFLHGPYSGAPSRDAVTISWSSSPPLTGWIEYGPRAWYESHGVLPNTVLVPAAASIILFIIIFLVTLFQLKVTQKRVHYQWQGHLPSPKEPFIPNPLKRCLGPVCVSNVESAAQRSQEGTPDSGNKTHGRSGN